MNGTRGPCRNESVLGDAPSELRAVRGGGGGAPRDSLGFHIALCLAGGS